MSKQQRYILDIDDLLQEDLFTPDNADHLITGVTARGTQTFGVAVGGLGNKVFADQEVLIYEASSNRVVSAGLNAGDLRNISRPGFIQWTASPIIPAGWLRPEGQEVLRAGPNGYPNLFTAIGVIHGVGDGSTTFNLPNCPNRVFMAVGGTHVLGETGGAEEVGLIAEQNGPHTHQFSILGDTSGPDDHQTLTFQGNGNLSLTYNTEPSGAGTPHNNMQPYITLYCLIRT